MSNGYKWYWYTFGMNLIGNGFTWWNLSWFVDHRMLALMTMTRDRHVYYVRFYDAEIVCIDMWFEHILLYLYILVHKGIGNTWFQLRNLEIPFPVMSRYMSLKIRFMTISIVIYTYYFKIYLVFFPHRLCFQKL
jgi:hypothetical protein